MAGNAAQNLRLDALDKNENDVILQNQDLPK
jgi:hypothetical protein